ncbi:MAG: STAS domain-containing protein [Planctomycetota bacterium]
MITDNHYPSDDLMMSTAGLPRDPIAVDAPTPSAAALDSLRQEMRQMVLDVIADITRATGNRPRRDLNELREKARKTGADQLADEASRVGTAPASDGAAVEPESPLMPVAPFGLMVRPTSSGLEQADWSRIEATIAAAPESQRRMVVLDLSAVTRITSLGIGRLIVLNDAVDADGGALLLVNVSRPVMIVLEMMGVESALHCHANMIDLVHLLRTGPSVPLDPDAVIEVTATPINPSTPSAAMPPASPPAMKHAPLPSQPARKVPSNASNASAASRGHANPWRPSPSMVALALLIALLGLVWANVLSAGSNRRATPPTPQEIEAHYAQFKGTPAAPATHQDSPRKPAR